jgi:hypothetical protein
MKGTNMKNPLLAVFRYSTSISPTAFYFNDPNWRNYPALNYRIRSP